MSRRSASVCHLVNVCPLGFTLYLVSCCVTRVVVLFSLRFHEHQTFQKPTNSGCGGTRLLFREVAEVTQLGSERAVRLLFSSLQSH